MATWGDLNTPQQGPGMFQRMTQQPARAQRNSPNPQLLQLLRMGQQLRARQKQGQTQQTTSNPYSPEGSPFQFQNNDQFWKHDLWENIQNDKRPRKWYEMSDPDTGGPGTGRLKVDQATMDRLGLKNQWYDEAESGPQGEGGYVDKYAAGEYLDPESVQKYYAEMNKNNSARPNSAKFGADWRPISEHDKYKVLDPKYVVYDENLGWITHKKNYNPDGDKSWWQKNAANVLPAAMGMLLGGPAGLAIGTGMAGVKAISGQTDWKSLLPSLLTAGLNMGGLMPSGFLGNLLRSGIKFGTGQLMNRGRG